MSYVAVMDRHFEIAQQGCVFHKSILEIDLMKHFQKINNKDFVSIFGFQQPRVFPKQRLKLLDQLQHGGRVIILNTCN